MITTMRSDIYRILRGKTIYVTTALLVALAVAQVVPREPGTIGINISASPRLDLSLAGPDTWRFLLGTANNIVFFIIPVVVIVAGGIFSSGTVKNACATGQSRTRLYAAKWLLSSAVVLGLVVVYLGSGLLSTTVVRGAGTWSAADVTDLVRSTLAQVVILWAFTSVGVALTFVLRNAGAPWAYLAFAVLPFVAAITMSETMTQEGFNATIPYNMLLSISYFAGWSGLTSTFIVTSLCVALAWLVVAVAIGIPAFARAEIK